MTSWTVWKLTLVKYSQCDVGTWITSVQIQSEDQGEGGYIVFLAGKLVKWNIIAHLHVLNIVIRQKESLWTLCFYQDKID